MLSLKSAPLSPHFHEKPTLHSRKAITSLAKFVKTTLLSAQGNIPWVTTLTIQSQIGAKAALWCTVLLTHITRYILGASPRWRNCASSRYWFGMPVTTKSRHTNECLIRSAAVCPIVAMSPLYKAPPYLTFPSLSAMTSNSYLKPLFSGSEKLGQMAEEKVVFRPNLCARAASSEL